MYTLCCRGPKLGHEGTLVAAMRQIADWLKKLGMSEYRFVENRIDISVLPDLTDQHLKDLGNALGDRLKMLRAIRDLGNAAAAVTAPSVPVATEPTRRDDAERRQLTVMFTDLVGSTARETPNQAARLQGTAEPNKVVIAEGSRRLLGNLFELQDLGPQDLKGIAGPVRGWPALRARSVESRRLP